jgi:hypothetical protein
MNSSINNKYNLKHYTFPSGKEVKVQGYEDLALTILLNNGYTEDDIIIDRNTIPTFQYIFKNKTRRYLPDIYIKSERKIIEVKSSRTFQIQRVQNTIKSLSVRKAGFDFEFWIFIKVLKHDTPNFKYNKSILKLSKL